jgi:hypothetical protein
MLAACVHVTMRSHEQTFWAMQLLSLAPVCLSILQAKCNRSEIRQVFLASSTSRLYAVCRQVSSCRGNVDNAASDAEDS